MNFQSEKQIILNFYDAIESSKFEEIPNVLSHYCSEDLLWRGFHPFNEIRGIKNLYSQPSDVFDTIIELSLIHI